MSEQLDTLVAEWLTAVAPTAEPPGLLRDVIERAGRTRQRRRFGELLLPPWAPRAVTAIAVIGAVTAALVGALIAGRQPTIPDGPRASIDGFRVPFTYGADQAEGLFITTGSDMVTFASLSNQTIGYAEGGLTPGARGIVVAWIGEALIHCTGSRTPVHTDPSGFLADAGGGSVRDDVVAGRPALALDLPATGPGCHPGDIHLRDGLFYGFYLPDASQLFALDVDGEPVAVLVWADSDTTLAAWQPVARRLLDSMRFEGSG
jgi:hypothetical protein